MDFKNPPGPRRDYPDRNDIQGRTHYIDQRSDNRGHDHRMQNEMHRMQNEMSNQFSNHVHRPEIKSPRSEHPVQRPVPRMDYSEGPPQMDYNKDYRPVFQAPSPARMSIICTKGLQNGPGENNCFLNSAVQVFWHLDVFRRSFRILSGHSCLGHACIFCALKVIFTQFQYSSQSVIPPESLRKALAETFYDQQRFQLGRMDDALECFENILSRIHFHLCHDADEDACNIPHCIPHMKFAMNVSERIVCPCGGRTDDTRFNQMVLYVPATALALQYRTWMEQEGYYFDPSERFSQLVGTALANGDQRQCPRNCGNNAQAQRDLLNFPDVISIGIIWDSERPDINQLFDIAEGIGTKLRLSELFKNIANPYCGQTTYELVGVVCYYGKHYSSFIRNTKSQTWTYFDDATVKDMGNSWQNVVDKCMKNHYQPLLLLYANPEGTVVNTHTAPKTTTIVSHTVPLPLGRHSRTSSRDSTLSSQGGASPANTLERADITKLSRSITPPPSKDVASSVVVKRRSVTPGPENKRNSEYRKSGLENARQGSFLMAVSGDMGAVDIELYDAEGKPSEYRGRSMKPDPDFEVYRGMKLSEYGDRRRNQPKQYDNSDSASIASGNSAKYSSASSQGSHITHGQRAMPMRQQSQPNEQPNQAQQYRRKRCDSADGLLRDSSEDSRQNYQSQNMGPPPSPTHKATSRPRSNSDISTSSQSSSDQRKSNRGLKSPAAARKIANMFAKPTEGVARKDSFKKAMKGKGKVCADVIRHEVTHPPSEIKGAISTGNLTSFDTARVSRTKSCDANLNKADIDSVYLQQPYNGQSCDDSYIKSRPQFITDGYSSLPRRKHERPSQPPPPPPQEHKPVIVQNNSSNRKSISYINRKTVENILKLQNVHRQTSYGSTSSRSSAYSSSPSMTPSPQTNLTNPLLLEIPDNNSIDSQKESGYQSNSAASSASSMSVESPLINASMAQLSLTNNQQPVPQVSQQQSKQNFDATQYEREGFQNQCVELCNRAEDLMRESENTEQLGDTNSALRVATQAGICLKQAMELPYIEYSSYIQAKTNYDASVLRCKGLQQRMIGRHESNASTKSGQSDGGSSINSTESEQTQVRQRSRRPAAPPRRSSLTNKSDDPNPLQVENNPVSNLVQRHNSVGSKDEPRTEPGENRSSDIYGTLPRRPKKNKDGTKNTQPSPYQEYLQKQNLIPNNNGDPRELLHNSISKSQSAYELNVKNSDDRTFDGEEFPPPPYDLINAQANQIPNSLSDTNIKKLQYSGADPMSAGGGRRSRQPAREWSPRSPRGRESLEQKLQFSTFKPPDAKPVSSENRPSLFDLKNGTLPSERAENKKRSSSQPPRAKPSDSEVSPYAVPSGIPRRADGQPLYHGQDQPDGPSEHLNKRAPMVYGDVKYAVPPIQVQRNRESQYQLVPAHKPMSCSKCLQSDEWMRNSGVCRRCDIVRNGMTHPAAQINSGNPPLTTAPQYNGTENTDPNSRQAITQDRSRRPDPQNKPPFKKPVIMKQGGRGDPQVSTDEGVFSDLSKESSTTDSDQHPVDFRTVKEIALRYDNPLQRLRPAISNPNLNSLGRAPKQGKSSKPSKPSSVKKDKKMKKSVTFSDQLSHAGSVENLNRRAQYQIDNGVFPVPKNGKRDPSAGYDSDYDEDTSDSCDSDDETCTRCTLCQKRRIGPNDTYCHDCRVYMYRFSAGSLQQKQQRQQQQQYHQPEEEVIDDDPRLRVRVV